MRDDFQTSFPLYIFLPKNVLFFYRSPKKTKTKHSDNKQTNKQTWDKLWEEAEEEEREDEEGGGEEEKEEKNVSNQAESIKQMIEAESSLIGESFHLRRRKLSSPLFFIFSFLFFSPVFPFSVF